MACQLTCAAAEAKEQVPSLVLVNGEDLTPYRQASKRIFSVLARFGVAERLGMDEVRSQGVHCRKSRQTYTRLPV